MKDHGCSGTHKIVMEPGPFLNRCYTYTVILFYPFYRFTNAPRKEMSEWICNQIFYSTLSNSKMNSTVKNLILIQDFISSLKFHGNISTHNVDRRGETTSLEERDLDKIFIWEKIMLFQPTVHESFLWEEVMIFEDTDLAIDQNCVF